MAGLIWTAVTLSLLLYVGNCEEPPAGPNLKQLSGIVNGIWKKYKSSFRIKNGGKFPMFSLAVSIPYDDKLKRYNVNGIPDTAEQLKATLSKCEVYSGTRMVAATLLKWPDVLDQCPNEPVQWKGVLPPKDSNMPMTWAEAKGVADIFTKADHAEYRTLTAFEPLIRKKKKNDFMLFYVYASPCSDKCTGDGDGSILESIKAINKWTNYAFVFTKVFRPKTGNQIDKEDFKGSLERLKNSIGLDHIFRCDGSKCTSCSSGGEVNPYCYEDPHKTASSNNLPFTSPNQLPSGSGGGKGLCRRGIGNKGKILSTNVDRRRLLAT